MTAVGESLLLPVSKGRGHPTPWETERGDTWKSTVVGQGAAEREEPPARASIPVSLGEDRQGRTAGLGVASLKDRSGSEAKASPERQGPQGQNIRIHRMCLGSIGLL